MALAECLGMGPPGADELESLHGWGALQVLVVFVNLVHCKPGSTASVGGSICIGLFVKLVIYQILEDIVSSNENEK